MTKTLWLSFVNEKGFAGVAIIDVTEEEAQKEEALLDLNFPNHEPGAGWLGAALRRAWREKCNPDGEVLSEEISQNSTLPRNTLLTRADLEKLGAI